MLKPIKYILIFIAFILLGSILLKKKETTGAQQFVIGTAAGYAPFVSINEKGDYEGFDIDFARALAQKMGRELVIKDLGSMTSLLMALQQGSIDAIIWGMSITPERLKNATMIHYQGQPTTAYTLLFWDNIPANTTRMGDLAGKTVCIEPSSVQEQLLNKYPKINKLPVDKVDDALLNLQYGKADSALVEPAIARKFQNKFPQIKTLEVPLAQDEQTQGIGIMLRKVNQNNNDLVQELQAAVDILTADKTVAKLEKKWDIPS